MEKSMDVAFKFGLMVQGMKVCGKTIKQTVTGHLFMQTATFMKGCGSTIKLMVMVLTNMQTEQLILENGSKTNNMVKALRLGQIMQDMMVCTKMERKMEWEHFHLLMVAFTQDSFI